MTADAFLAMVDGVRSVGPGRWLSRCPSHPDKRPSLSIREGERALLLKCWAGCSLDHVCRALGVGKHELFYDSGRPVDRQTIERRQRERVSRYAWKAEAKALKFESYTLWMQAEAVLSKARGLDVSRWSDEELEAAWEAIEAPLRQRIESDRLEDEAFSIRDHGLRKERNTERGRSTESAA